MFFLSIGNDGKRKQHACPTMAQLWLLGHDGGMVRPVQGSPPVVFIGTPHTRRRWS